MSQRDQFLGIFHTGTTQDAFLLARKPRHARRCVMRHAGAGATRVVSPGRQNLCRNPSATTSWLLLADGVIVQTVALNAGLPLPPLTL